MSRRSLIDADGNTLPDSVSTQPLFARDQMVDGMSLGNLCLRHNLNFIGEPSIVLYRNGVLPPAEMFTYGGSSFWINSDLVLWLKLLACGPAYYVAQPLSCFRVHDGQISARSATPCARRHRVAPIPSTRPRRRGTWPTGRWPRRLGVLSSAPPGGSAAPSVGDESLLRQLMVSVAEQAARGVVAGDQPFRSTALPLPRLPARPTLASHPAAPCTPPLVRARFLTSRARGGRRRNRAAHPHRLLDLLAGASRSRAPGGRWTSARRRRRGGNGHVGAT